MNLDLYMQGAYFHHKLEPFDPNHKPLTLTLILWPHL